MTMISQAAVEAFNKSMATSRRTGVNYDDTIRSALGIVADIVLGDLVERIDIEPMSGVFTKYHIRGPWPFHPVIHRFGDVDRGDPHDHPWAFRSIILHGGYVERVFALDGSSTAVRRELGDSFRIEATHIHRIEELLDGECWTLILPEEGNRTSGFWQFRDDGAYSRKWNEQDWTKMGVIGYVA